MQVFKSLINFISQTPYILKAHQQKIDVMVKAHLVPGVRLDSFLADYRIRRIVKLFVAVAYQV